MVTQNLLVAMVTDLSAGSCKMCRGSSVLCFVAYRNPAHFHQPLETWNVASLGGCVYRSHSVHRGEVGVPPSLLHQPHQALDAVGGGGGGGGGCEGVRGGREEREY